MYRYTSWTHMKILIRLKKNAKTFKPPSRKFRAAGIVSLKLGYQFQVAYNNNNKLFIFK